MLSRDPSSSSLRPPSAALQESSSISGSSEAPPSRDQLLHTSEVSIPRLSISSNDTSHTQHPKERLQSNLMKSESSSNSLIIHEKRRSCSVSPFSKPQSQSIKLEPSALNLTCQSEDSSIIPSNSGLLSIKTTQGKPEHSTTRSLNPMSADTDNLISDTSSVCSGNSRQENEDLQFATSRNENVVLELDIDGLIRHLSSNWQSLLGTPVEDLINKPSSSIVIGNAVDKNVFIRATEVMKTDESSYRVRFVTQKPKGFTHSSIHSEVHNSDVSDDREVSNETAINEVFPVPIRACETPQASPFDSASSCHTPMDIDGDTSRGTLNSSQKWPQSDPAQPSQNMKDSDELSDDMLEIEGQGVLIYDHVTNQPSHTMWILRPYIPPKPLSVDLPLRLVNTLGFGVNMLVSFLESLSDAVIEDLDSVPTPPLELCRICERYVPTWWFEGHSELCLVDHKMQSDLDAANENLVDQKNTISQLLTLMDMNNKTPSEKSPSPQTVSSLISNNSLPDVSSTSIPSTPQLEYRGFFLPFPIQSPATATPSPPCSPGPAFQLSSSSKRPLVKSLTAQKRSPLKMMELLLELCDLSMEIKGPEISNNTSSSTSDLRLHSPKCAAKINKVLNWVSPQTDDPGMTLLCEDTFKYARHKVDIVLRLVDTMTYFETITRECEAMVLDAIEDTMDKANQQKSNDCCESEQEDKPIEVEYDSDETDLDDSSNFFSKSYLQSDNLPSASTSANPRHLPEDNKELHHSHDLTTSNLQKNDLQSSSVTPKSFLSNPNCYTNIAISKPSQSTPTRLKRRVTLDNFDFQPPDLDLNAEGPPTRTQIKRTISNISSISSSSPQRSPTWTSIQRNRIHAPSSEISNPSTPICSPLITPHETFSDNFHLRRQYSINSDMSRGPTSPLLTSTVPLLKPAPPSIKDYEIINPISKGAFGSVYLARKKITGEYFAIKVLKKADMIAKNQVRNVRAERAIMMSQAESPFVANLYFTFQSKNYLYLVMEYLNGGDCAALVKVLGGLPEEWAKKYIAEVIVGVEDLHKKGIIHRDLKPDNLLINQRGHLKLTDFGLSRMGLVGRHTRQNSTAFDATPSLDTAGILDALSKSPMKFPTTFEEPNSSPLIQASPAGTIANTLMDPTISLVPGYFNLNPKILKDRRSSSSIGSAAGEAFFNNALLFRSTGLTDHEEETTSSNSSEVRMTTTANDSTSSGGSSGNTIPVGYSNSNNVSTPLFDPTDNTKKFVGTPDYLAPETIRGIGQDERSDWWSVGCILFEFLFGYPPFHASTPELVFENILNQNIQWPDIPPPNENNECVPSDHAVDLIKKLLSFNQTERLGTNGGATEIKAHSFLSGIKWDTLWDEEASFIPVSDNPESTDYFDPRGADTQPFLGDNFALEEDEDENKSENTSDGSPGSYSGKIGSNDPTVPFPGRKDQRSKFPLHIPPHVLNARNRRLSEPAVQDDFGNFAFKNLPMLDKANKSTLSRIVTENMERRNSFTESSKRPRGLSISAMSVFKRPDSPSMSSARHASPIRRLSSSRHLVQSTPATKSLSTIITNFSSPSSTSSNATSPYMKSHAVNNDTSISMTSTSPLPRDGSKLLTEANVGSGAVPLSPFLSPDVTASTRDNVAVLPPAVFSGINPNPQTPISPSGLGIRRLSSLEFNSEVSENVRSQYSSQYPQVFDISPSNSDTEEIRSSPVSRLQNQTQLFRKGSNLSTPAFRPLIVLISESNPVWRYSMEQLVKGLNCRFVTVSDTADTIRCATGDVKFDLIFTEFKFPKTNGADVARIIRTTSNPNTETPIVCVTNYAAEATNAGRTNFSSIITKPPTVEKLRDALEKYCSWKPKGRKVFKSPPEAVKYFDNDPSESL